MEEQSLIKELYNYFDEVNLGFSPNTSEYEMLRKEREKAYAALEKLLPEGSENILENFLDAAIDVVLMDEKEIYRQGVCLGVKLTAEAFITNRNTTVTRNLD